MRYLILLLFFPAVMNSQAISELFEESGLPGFSIAKVNSEGLIYEESHGYSNLETKPRRAFTTKQNIASASKLFLGIALMKAVEKDLLSLDSPINEFLPFQVENPRHPSLPITVRMLANHTSSIIDYEIEFESVYLTDLTNHKELKVKRNTKKYFKKWGRNDSEELPNFLKSSLVKRGIYYSRKRYSKKKPGETHSYSNLGTALLGLVIESVVGVQLSDFIENEIFVPLGMNNSSWDFEETDGLASYYFENRSIVPDYVSILFPAGGINSTCEDLAKFLAAIIRCYEGSGGLISPDSAQKMFTGQLDESQNTLAKGKNYGFLAEISGSNIGHNGGNYGVTVLFSFNIENGEGRIFMSNISSYESSVLLPKMVKIYKAI